MELIPESEIDLLKDLAWNLDDSSYKAPEETLQWVRTMRTLQKHIPKPIHDWEFEILSIFTTKSIQELEQNVISREASSGEREKQLNFYNTRIQRMARNLNIQIKEI